MTNQWISPIDWDALSGLFVDATDLNEQLRNNAEFLYSRPFNYVNNTTQTTTSTSFVEMTSSSVALTSYGGNMLVIASGKAKNSGLSANYFDLAIDGTRQGDATNGLTRVTTPAANYWDCVSMTWFTSTPPSAASHNYSIYWKVSAGTASGLFRVYVMEIR